MIKSRVFRVFMLGLILTTQWCPAQKSNLDSIGLFLENHVMHDSHRVNALIDYTQYHFLRDFNDNLPLIDEALQISEDIGYVRGIGLAKNTYSKLYIYKGEFDKALQFALEAKVIFDSINDQQQLKMTMSHLAKVYTATKKYDKALSIHLENIKSIQHEPASAKKAGLNFYVAKTYQEMDRLDSAEHFYIRALEISDSCGFSTGRAIAEGSLATVYMEKKDFDQSIIFYNKSLDFAKKNNQGANLAASYYGLGYCYRETGQYELGLLAIDQAIIIYEKSKHKLLHDAYDIKSDCLERLGRHKQALEFARNSFTLRDSLFNENKFRTVEELQTKYETEKKEAEIASLSQQATIRELEIQRKNQMIWFGLALVAFGGLGAYLFVRQKALKQREARTEIEQRFLRSQLNPHFIFNALMAIQNFMLKNSAQEAALYLSKFSKLMREILENSREEFIPVEAEIEMLTNYLEIHKLRLNNSFNYKIEVDQNIDLEGDTIPPMFIQPFVENAIEHGIINSKEKGLIELNFTKENEHITIEVLDNGGGVKSTDSNNKHQSLATTIINERMALFNKSLKEKIRMVLEERKNDKNQVEGMRIQLKVPFSYV